MSFQSPTHGKELEVYPKLLLKVRQGHELYPIGLIYQNATVTNVL